MRAIVCTKYGSPDDLQLKQVEKPTPKDNEILVKVFATTVNRTDCGILWGKPFFIRFFTGLVKPKPILGTDFAGIVEALGKNVKSYKVGDKVFGFDDISTGSHAQYLTIAEDKGITTMLQNTSYESAAASSEGAHYAYNFIKKVKLKKGDKVLVNGATGAIGSAAVQFLKHLGTDITATCRTKNFKLVKSLGANSLIDYTKEDFTKVDNKYDLVFDAVGKSTFFKCKQILKQGGVYISSELGPFAQNPFLAIMTLMFGKVPLQDSKKVIFPFPTDIPRSLLFTKKLIRKGKFIAVIDRKYPLEKIPMAYKYVKKGQKKGNVVITVKHA